VISNNSNQFPQTSSNDPSATDPATGQLPSVTLPTGGGAIKGISESFAANPVTGTASFSIPLPAAAGRGFSPELSLNYDSGSGNSPFGVGWQVNIPAISRKTDKRLPRYQDSEESDVYMFSGLEDLVPFLTDQNGSWQPLIENKTEKGVSFEVKRYRPRTEGSFYRIERWRRLETDAVDIHWRIWSRSNVLSVFGETHASRIFDPNNPDRVFQWLLTYSQDDKGNRIEYVYKREDLSDVDLGAAFEHHRIGQLQANLYPKKILYGNKVPYWQQVLREGDYLFQTVFDYGEHDAASPRTVEDLLWPVRHDPFSTYRSGFEIRTYRRCQRVLQFHNFAELGNEPTLVRSLDLTYDHDGTTVQAGFSFVTEITQRSYQRNNDDGYDRAALPPMTFDYQAHAWQTNVEAIAADSLQNLPAGVDGQQYRWLDLYGEGLTGILSAQASRLTYKRNLGNSTFSPAVTLSPVPSLPGVSTGNLQFQSLAADGQLCLVAESGSVQGYYRLKDDESWEAFETFKMLPSINLRDPNIRRIDLTGNGQPDLLITEDTVLRWHPADGLNGFEAAEQAGPFQTNEHDGPAVIFANEAETIFLADMSGDGLQDVVRIRNGQVVYWPNLGYGRFGTQITMGYSPRFDVADQFDPRRIQLADLDGSGATDLIYLGHGEIRYWLNLSGNRWSETQAVINPFPEVNAQTSVSVFDLLGTGTGCIVWSSTLPAHAHQPVRYIDLMGSVKPHLMIGYSNGMGKQVNLAYTPSTKFYLEDRAKGTPWITKLHFPVHCLSKVEAIDEITGTRYVSEYSYHHGYYDRAEREFRGFGRVDQRDTESFEHFSASSASNVVERPLYQPPVLTKTWFHTGATGEAGKILAQYRHEYYPDPDATYIDTPLPEPELPPGLTAAEWREALRACRGLALRAEVYGLDGTALEPHPYSIAEKSCRIVQVQPTGGNLHAVFQVIESESLSVQLDRNPTDPRVGHRLTLEVDEYGQPVKTASVGYPRRLPGPEAVREHQYRYTISLSTAEYTNDLDEDTTYRLRQPCEGQVWEIGYPAAGENDSPWILLTRQSLLDLFEDAAEIGYEAQQANVDEKRLLQHSRTYFLKNDLSGPLPLGRMGRLGMGYQSQTLAFTPQLLNRIYSDRVTPTMLEQGGYIHSRGSVLHNDTWVDGPEDDNWWLPSGTPVFDSDPTEMFYLPIGSRDPFGNEDSVDYDPYYLLVKTTTNALGQRTRAVNDYRLLQPVAVQDPNGNWSAVETDVLGMVVKTALLGKLAPGQDPLTATASEGDTLANPTAALEYDLHNWRNSEEPNYVKTVAWEEHFAANPNRTKTQVKYEYSDGSGNVVMVKAQAEPGVAKQRQPDGTIVEVDTTPDLRWIGNGRTVLNNKGNPVKQYEPYFSVTPEYEDAAELVEVGVTPIIFYDAPGRQVCRSLPNHSFEKVLLSPWRSESWDVNDTLLITDPALDLDVGAYFDDLDPADYLPSWYDARIDGALGPEAQRVAQVTQAAGHPNTPAVAYADALGRTVYAEANNGGDGIYTTRTELDLEGNTLAVIDDRGNTVMAYRYNQLPPPDRENPKPALYQKSMDGGEQWILFNVVGQPLYSWDSRNHIFQTGYDALQRPTHSWLTENKVEKLIGLTIYGEDAPDPAAGNLLGQVWQLYDQAGWVENSAFDFKGNLLTAKRTLAEDYAETIDWQTDPAGQLQSETFVSSSEYDGLNRLTSSLSPHHATLPASELRPVYNESGGLDRVDVSVRGGPLETYVSEIEYDAKGQRQSIVYGNGVTTQYTYDPETYRLTRLLTERSSDGAVLQDLNYVYDPVGNITEIRDEAQQTVFFSNQVVEPHHTFSYDPLYRLREATGREHAIQAADRSHRQGWSPQAHPNSGQHLRRYTQTYTYDGVGNILQMRHTAAGDSWTRAYTYATDSNRLLETTIGSIVEPYTYNAHGSITSMNHLSELIWDFSEQLRQVTLDQAGGRAYYVYDGSGQRIRKIHEHAGTTVEERIYLGGWEIYRKRVNGNLNLERETLHVMDDHKRIALIETKTVDNGDPVANPQPLMRYQLGNHLGSAALELNDGGDIISYEEFHPYGTTAYHAGTNAVEDSPKRYRYTGKERDEETGFSYHGARYYSCWLGRWGSKDPAGLVDGINLYAYVSGNPARKFDSSGYAEADTTNVIEGELEPINRELEKIVNNYIKAAREVVGIKPGVQPTDEQKREFVFLVSQLGFPRGAGIVDTTKAIFSGDASHNKSKIEKLALERFETKEPGYKYTGKNVFIHGPAWMFNRQAINPSVVFVYEVNGLSAEIPIGTDKLGHFFAQGYEYFEIANIQGKGKVAAIEYGEKTEKEKFGLQTTGVFSYADLEANLSGLQFYIDIWNDPFTTFQTNNYLTPEWNEEVNPNFYSKNMARLLLENENNPTLYGLFDDYQDLYKKVWSSKSKNERESILKRLESIEDEIKLLVKQKQGVPPN
jgi:RHS repeat-associated protein